MLHNFPETLRRVEAAARGVSSSKSSVMLIMNGSLATQPFNCVPCVLVPESEDLTLHFPGTLTLRLAKKSVHE